MKEVKNKEIKKKKEKKKKRKHLFLREKVRNSETDVKFLKKLGWFIGDVWWFIRKFVKRTIALSFIFGLVICGVFITKIKDPIESYYRFAEETAKNSTSEDFNTYRTTYIYDSDGKVLVELNNSTKSFYLEYSDIPKNVVNAFIAVEDRTFWENPGVDIKGIIRVAKNFVVSSGEDVAGASTITQQLVRMKYLTNEVSLPRKIKEIFTSLKIGEKYTKSQIMEFYVNNCYFANGQYGIDAAAQYYFGVPSNDLTLSQTAYLCAIPNGPTYYNPRNDYTRALVRRDKILEDMLECTFISKEEYDNAIKEEIQIVEKKESVIHNYQTTFAIECAVETIMEHQGFEFKYKFDSQQEYLDYEKLYAEAYDIAKSSLYKDGYRIYTSLNSEVQTKMQTVLNNRINDGEINQETGIYALQSAMTVIDNKTGNIIAVIGGREQDITSGEYTFNRAYQAYRQPGSTMKPLAVYTPAFMKEYTPNSVLKEISVTEANKQGTDVSKLSGKNMKLSSAVINSKNGSAYYVFNDIGVNYGVSFLQEMEFARLCPNDYNLSTALGGLTYGTTTVEMASAYAAIANHGVYRGATCITSILNYKDKEIYKPISKKVYDPIASDTMVDVMKDVIKSGTAKSMKWSSSSKTEASGKTGTTNDLKDGWFCGSTPYYTISVWVGYDTPRTINEIYGKYSASLVWKDAMLELIKDLPEATFEKSMEYLSENDTNKEEFMPGRSDDEVLSPGYTVGDYRKDHTIGAKIDAIITLMNALDKSHKDFKAEADKLYSEGQALVQSIYGNTLKTQKRKDLNNAYAKLGLLANTQDSNESSNNNTTSNDSQNQDNNNSTEQTNTPDNIQNNNSNMNDTND